MRVWLSTFPRMGDTTRVAIAAEEAGFHGMLLTDSQCLAPDPFLVLGAVADATTDLHIGTCATNVVTRHPSVLASLAASLQQRSSGRMHLGVARGDSALTKVGLHPVAPDAFGAALASVRALLHGETAVLDGRAVSLSWLDPSVPATPVVGVASGPRTIAGAAGNADELILQVGSDPEAVARAVRLARDAARSPDLRIAAYVIVGLEQEGGGPPPIDGVTTLLARMAARTLADDRSPQAAAAAAATRAYTVATHGLPAADDEARATEQYAVVGTAASVTDQLQRIAATGCDELVVILDSMSTNPVVLVDLVRAFGDAALPTLTAIG